MAAPNMGDLMRRIGKVEHRTKQLEDRFAKLADRFALYWFNDLRPPAFAIVLGTYEGEDENKQKATFADLFIVTQHLGKADITLQKRMLRHDDKVKAMKWEPLVLPKEVLDLLSAAQKEEPEESDERDSALTP